MLPMPRIFVLCQLVAHHSARISFREYTSYILVYFNPTAVTDSTHEADKARFSIHRTSIAFEKFAI